MLRMLTMVHAIAGCGQPKFDGAAFCDELAEHACTAFDACGCPDDAACHADQELACLRSFTAYVGAADLGLLETDGTAARACLDAYAATTASCAAPTSQNQPRACQDIFSDPAEIGALCAPVAVGLRCADGAGACDGARVCQGLTSTETGCDLTGRCAGDAVCDQGQCVTPGVDGGACITDVGCAVGWVCQSGVCAAPAPDGAACVEEGDCSKGLTCRDGVCAPALPSGEACPGVGCGADATCVPTADARACAPLATLGETCESWDACADGLLCDFLQTPGVCVPAPTAGEPCPLGTCADDATCVQGVCAARAPLGEPCGGTYLGCEDGAACDLTTGLCAPLGGEGDACLGDERACAPGLLCDPLGSSNLCIAPYGEGVACMGIYGLCAEGLYCGGSDLVCTPVQPLGATCETFDACGVDAACVDGVCAARPSAEGEACLDACLGDLRCTSAPGVCSAGVCALAQVPAAQPQ